MRPNLSPGALYFLNLEYADISVEGSFTGVGGDRHAAICSGLLKFVRACSSLLWPKLYGTTA